MRLRVDVDELLALGGRWTQVGNAATSTGLLRAALGSLPAALPGLTPPSDLVGPAPWVEVLQHWSRTVGGHGAALSRAVTAYRAADEVCRVAATRLS